MIIDKKATRVQVLNRNNILAKPKRSAVGEGVLMIYRIILIAIIAFVVLGTSAVVYDYYVDVRGIEARIMAKQVVNCLEPQGSLVSVPDLSKTKILNFCGIKNTERFYVQINVSDLRFEQGDSGALWIKQMFDTNKDGTKNIKKYEPGYYFDEFDVNYNNQKTKLKIMVLVNNEL